MAELDTGLEASSPSADEKNIMVLTHLGGILFSVFPSLIVWLLKGKDSPYLENQAREALNFQITILIAQVVSSALILIFVGLVLMAVIWLANIVLSFLAAVAASKGVSYRYPLTVRLIS